MTKRAAGEEPVGVRLHLGCGDKRLEGWINIDGQALPGVDVVADLRRPLDFDNVEAVFAEHFIEHLRIEDTLRLFAELHRVLRPGGVVRLSTPNLDWVWSYCYHLEERPGGGRTQAALVLNRAFHAWGHQFLWNEPILRAALTASGFVDLRACRYGQSDVPFLRGLERHETYPDSEEMPHVVILEARRGEPAPGAMAEFRRLVEEHFLVHLDDQFEATGGDHRVEALEAEVARLRRQLTTLSRDVERSVSFRLGRALTAPMRWVRDGLRAGSGKAPR